jgi:hypothetical protein
LTWTTPPFFAIRFNKSSGMLRGTSLNARAEEWEAMIGAFETSSASLIVSSETCDTSTSIPRRFISRTTSRPKSFRPPCFFCPRPASAQLFVLFHVNVM